MLQKKQFNKLWETVRRATDIVNSDEFFISDESDGLMAKVRFFDRERPNPDSIYRYVILRMHYQCASYAEAPNSDTLQLWWLACHAGETQLIPWQTFSKRRNRRAKSS